MNAYKNGFTLIETTMVIALMAILAIVAIPRLTVIFETAPYAGRDQVAGAVRLALHHAASHRRLVCVQVTASTLVLQVAASNPAGACGTATIPSSNGSSNHLTVSDVTLSPAQTLYVQSNGRVTSDVAGSTPATFTITATRGGADAAVTTVRGVTGVVE